MKDILEFKKMISIASKLTKKFCKNVDGTTAIEYGLIAGLVSIIIITGLTTLGTNLSNVFNQVANSL